MKILITGGAGFIGSHLAEYLLEQGNHVTVIDDFSTGRMENIKHLAHHANFTLVRDTILNEQVMHILIEDCQQIYHLAAAVGVKLIVEKPVHTISTNIAGTEIVLKIANKFNRKIIMMSSSEVYGKNTHVPFKEEDDSIMGATIYSRWSYASSKAIDEFLGLAYFRQYGLPVIIVRLFNTVGPRQVGQYGMVIPRFVKQALSGLPITVYGDGLQTRCFTYVSDVVEALVALMDNVYAIGEVFNLGSSREVSIMNLAKMIKEKTSSSSDISIIPYDQAYEKGFDDLIRRVPDTSKIKSVINFEPKYNLDAILDEVIKYYKRYPCTN